MSGRQRFIPEFKAIAVEEVVEKNRMIADVAREMKVLPGTLGNWVCRYREKHPVVEEPLSLSERAELASLRREVGTQGCTAWLSALKEHATTRANI